MENRVATALIAIGVGKTNGEFHELKGAAQDAKQFHDWGVKQGFDCALLTDTDRKIRVADVYDEISARVSKGIYSQLVVYFSGHGVLQAPDCELWLMSGAPDNPNEVINVCGSIQAARSTGIEHIVFISDACRTLPTAMKTATLSGQLVFKFYGGNRPPYPEIDVFYATIPGDVALELPPDPKNLRDRGLLTQCLLDALAGNVPDVIHSQTHAGVVSRVVPCRPLKTWLTSAVPNAATMISVHLRQVPDIRIESDSPKYLAKLSDLTDALSHKPMEMSLPQLESSRVSGVRQPMRLTPSRGAKKSVLDISDTSRHRVRSSPALKSFVDYKIDGVESGQNSIDFAENRSGVVVQGGEILSAISSFGPISPWPRPTQSWCYFPPVDTHSWDATQPISLRIAGGNGIVLPLIPGYIATVNLNGGDIASIRYRLTHAARGQRSSTVPADKVERQLASLEAKARLGMLTSSDLSVIGQDRLMALTLNDPLAAIYAGYAFSRSGRYKDIQALEEAMQRHLGFVPFDIALLAGQLKDSPYPAVAPGIPLLTQGWLMLGRFEHQVPQPLKIARSFMRASLWATFSDVGMDLVEQHLFGA